VSIFVLAGGGEEEIPMSGERRAESGGLFGKGFYAYVELFAVCLFPVQFGKDFYAYA
jgi:hypothetical protein